MSNTEMAFLALAIVACVVFMVVIGWVDWSTSRKPRAGKEQVRADADSDVTTYRPFIRS
ncbi:MAG: hypothetical protein ACHQAY_13475 [Hyphomicrobiales bacterium]